jgi:nuclear pore complex protein Nup133
MTTRSRRRQRPLSSDNSLPQPKSKRLRSDRPQITDQTFVEPPVAPETFEVKAAQPASVEIKQDGIERPIAVPRRELSVRSKKGRPGDRLHKGDGTTLLVSRFAVCSIFRCRVRILLTYLCSLQTMGLMSVNSQLFQND